MTKQTNPKSSLKRFLILLQKLRQPETIKNLQQAAPTAINKPLVQRALGDLNIEERIKQASSTITSNGFWQFYYTAAGLHALHVIAGAIIMGFIARDAAKGKGLHRVELIGIYWHFVDVVWIFLFPLLYIAK